MNSAAKDIAAEIAESAGVSLSNLGLRFDRVATRVLSHLSSAADRALPEGVIVLFAITAPIRLPVKTISVVIEQMNRRVCNGDCADLETLINENSTRMKILYGQSVKRLNFIGFIYNADESALRLFDLAEAWVRCAASELEQSKS